MSIKNELVLKKPKIEAKEGVFKMTKFTSLFDSTPCASNGLVKKVEDNDEKYCCKILTNSHFDSLCKDDTFSKKIKIDSNLTHCTLCDEEIHYEKFQQHLNSLGHKLFMAQKLRREIEAQNYQSKKTLSSGAQYQAEYFQTASGMHMKYGGYIYHRMDQTPNYTKWRCINALLEEKRCYVTAKVVNEIVAVLQEHNHDPDKNGLISLELTHRKRKSGNSSKNSISKEVSEDAHGIQVSQFGFAYFYCKHCRKDYPFTGPSSIRAHILSNHHIQNATLSQSVNKTMSDDSNQKSEYKYKESYTKCFTGIQPSSKGDTYFYCACCLLNAPILHQQTVQFHVGTRKHIERLKLYKKMLSLRSNKQEKSDEEDKEETLKSE